MSKYLIVKTTPDNVNTGGRYPISADNILSIINGLGLQIVYAGGIVVKVTMVENLKVGDEGAVTYFTSRIKSLQESSNNTLEIDNVIPNVYGGSGNPMKIASIDLCLYTAAC
tara:strand:- start:2345 stop:2680 length:336 start_codon:yes stop_codon:yes gene_type:complete